MIFSTALKLLRRKTVQNLFFIIAKFITTSMVVIVVNMLNNSFYDYMITSNGSQIIFTEDMITNNPPMGDYFPLIFMTLIYSVFSSYFISHVFFRKNLQPAISLMLTGYPSYSSSNIILAQYGIMVLPAIAVSFVLSVKVFIPVIDRFIYSQFDIVNAPVGRIYYGTYILSMAILFLIIAFLLLYYGSKFYRNTISDLQHDDIRPASVYKGRIVEILSTSYNLFIYLGGILLYLLFRNTLGSLICLIAGIFGSLGMLSQSIPNLVKKMKKDSPGEWTYIVLSNYARDLRESFVTVSLLLVSVISTVTLLARSTHHQINYYISCFSLAAIIAMICINIISQFFMNQPARIKENRSLFIEGIPRDQIRILTGWEMILYFATIFVIPGIYVLITLIDSSLSHVLSYRQAMILGAIFALPVIITFVFTMIYCTLNAVSFEGAR